MSVYSTPSLRVGVYRCPPGNALWHETNDNIGERPHVVFPGTAVGLVRDGVRLTATPNDVVFYRPFETYERSLRDDAEDLLVEETAIELVGRALGTPVPESGRRARTRRARTVYMIAGAPERRGHHPHHDHE